MPAPAVGGVLKVSDAQFTATVDISSVPVGGWMIAYMVVSTLITPNAPAGWTALTPTATQASGSRTSALYGKIKTSPAETSLVWGIPGATPSGKKVVVVWGTDAGPVSGWVKGSIGVRAAGDVVAGQSVQAGSATTSTAPSVTVPADTAVVSILMEATSAAGTFTLTSGATLVDTFVEDSIIEQIIVAKSAPAAGNTLPVYATAVASQASNGLGVQIALPYAAALAGLPVKTGSGADAHATYLPGRKTPTSLKPFQHGFASVQQMLDTPGATWAHRGGSASYPEMSEWAYDQAAMRGYGVLEFSASRTSDGWWFGLHDDTTDRTSGGTFGTAATQTKAQVQAQQIVVGAAGAPRPYYGLVDFIRKFGSSHVLVFDVKNASSFLSEFLDIIAAEMPTSRAIIKFYGVGSGAGGIADAARARGMKSWGYFYQVDVDNGGLAAWQSKWDLLGMDIAATTGWTAALSYGKPVVGHIAATQADYTSAIAKGARAVQCAGVAVIAPVST